MLVLVCLLLPLNVFAMKHGSMSMEGETILLGEGVVGGIKASATLLDVSIAMARHGM